MASNALITFATTFMLCIFVVATYANEQNKPGQTYKFCGNEFSTTHQDCCQLGYPACANRVPGEGGIEALERKGSPLMLSRVAKNFLGLRKRSWGEDSNVDTTAAVEECCVEGCSYGEIMEYPCF